MDDTGSDSDTGGLWLDLEIRYTGRRDHTYFLAIVLVSLAFCVVSTNVLSLQGHCDRVGMAFLANVIHEYLENRWRLCTIIRQRIEIRKHVANLVNIHCRNVGPCVAKTGAWEYVVNLTGNIHAIFGSQCWGY